MAETNSSRRITLSGIRLQSSATKQSANAPGVKSGPVLDQNRGVHAGLWLDKYITNLQRDDNQSHSELVRDVANLATPAIYKKYYVRWKSYLGKIDEKKRDFHEFAVKGRMAVGLGNEGVLETSIALHHTYGVPYIPGSALKGLAASYARLMGGPAWSEKSEAYQVVFGDTDNAGFITFFDALYVPGSAPAQPPPMTTREQPADLDDDHPLHIDVITVHHPEYYKGKASPADWDSPTPIPFLSANGNYLVALAALDLDNSDMWIARAFEILEEALLIMGIGAKTSSGYGRLKIERQEKELTQNVSNFQSVRLDLPTFIEDQQIVGIVSSPTQREIIQKILPDSEAQQILAYQDNRKRQYSLDQVVLIVSNQSPDVLNWRSGDQHNCRIKHQEKRDGRLIIHCEAVPSKFANKKKKQ